MKKFTIIQLFEYSKEHVNEKHNVSLSEIVDLSISSNSNWVNIYGLNDTELIASLCKKQNIDNLVIQDILDINQRPKFQYFDNYFKTLDKISKEVERLNWENINKDPSPNVLEEIEKHKVSVHFIKNAIHPIKEFVIINERDTNQFIENRNLHLIILLF